MSVSILQSQRVVLPCSSGLEVVPARVHIHGNTIQRVDRLDGETPADPGGALDLGDQLISPAFINAHTHLSMSMFRGLSGPDQLQTNVVENLFFEVEQHLTPADIRAFIRMGAYESLLAGVGCVWDHYYGQEAAVEAFRETGLCAVFAPTLQDIGGPAAERTDAVLDFTLSLAADTAANQAGVVAALGPHATDTVSVELWGRLARLSQDHSLPIHVHIAQSIEELERSHAQHGVSNIGKLQMSGVLDAAPAMMMVHGLYVSHADLAQLDPQRHVLGYCPFSQVQFDFPAQLESWRHAGLRFALGTDCGGCNDSMSVQQELRLVAGGHAFETTWGAEHDAFRASGRVDDAQTVSRARRRRFARNMDLNDPSVLLSSVWSVPGSMHPALPLGRIEEGYRANLAIWNTQHPAFWPGKDPLRALAFGDIGGALHGLMIHGSMVGELGNYANSILSSEGYRASREEADARLDALLGSLGLR